MTVVDPAFKEVKISTPKTERFWYPYLLIAPTMITLVTVSLVPFMYTIYMSLHHVKYGKVGDFAWFANYANVLADPRFWNSLEVAGLFVLIAVPIEFMIGLGGGAGAQSTHSCAALYYSVSVYPDHDGAHSGRPAVENHAGWFLGVFVL